jgi:hypothetical protein
MVCEKVSYHQRASFIVLLTDNIHPHIETILKLHYHHAIAFSCNIELKG